MKIGMSTPWGRAQDVTKIADQLFFVSTPGHGGFWVGPDRRKLMPSWLLAKTDFYEGATWPWFEEDCEALRVMIAFPDLFPKHNRAKMLDLLQATYPGQFAEIR